MTRRFFLSARLFITAARLGGAFRVLNMRDVVDLFFSEETWNVSRIDRL